MGVRTGNPRGRPRGAKNKRTKELEAEVERAAHVIAEVIPGAFDGDAHAFLMAVYKDPLKDFDLRLRAATAAIRYEKPPRAPVGEDGNTAPGAVVYVDTPRVVPRA